eukprot:CAMPEP_0183294704 /NCGR_PEP_ID=MMETSP0160_2-20130417/2933_1 /TAXON_ID=2839 ORGANISM="Odontella Sinensis, Strain Grunow 1884" /NCGR_SAMPLE_ID=MMETSP0160_2 /ASSEMBLY_ACC=CAM_ASM_000250 /LENGTH=246 /DNA_ID=CAMNT_0025456063 /DNA_START=25 /DNA_END=765 /DNA_ORIENTATION=+
MIQALANYRPIIIEGMGWYDPRNPYEVASQIVKQLESHFATVDTDGTVPPTSSPHSASRSKLLITQGDPLSERGISAITPIVAEKLGIRRGLITLDSHINPNHCTNAPRDNVVLELKYSDLVRALDPNEGLTDEEVKNGNEIDRVTAKLERRVEEHITMKNERRRKLGKPPLKTYFKDFAMLQEVTKAACLRVCGDITVAHTAATISEFSVTSFYEVGLELGLLDKHHYVDYGLLEELDFEKIDTR